jgi:hypothetical protein
MKRARRMPFIAFCERVLRLEFTLAWLALLKIAIDGLQPRDLAGDERAVARLIFGDVEEIDPRLRRVLVWRLGRASGKTTIAAALAIYAAWTVALPRDGRGQIPVSFVVSPSKPTSKILVALPGNRPAAPNYRACWRITGQS